MVSSMGVFNSRRFLSPEVNETAVYKPSYDPTKHVVIVLKKAHHISPLLIILVAILGGCFLVVSYYAIIVKFCTNLNNSRRPQQPQNEDNEAAGTLREDFLDENHGPVLDHPIWYIRTIGLAQTIIDSIGVVKYKKGEGLVEGTDCSVCLSEFEEDETLRLLPKCSHAFHLPCIDTWLGAHTNCPSCRAPVVASSALVPAPTSDVAEETTQVGNSEDDDESGSELSGEDEVSDLRIRVQDEWEEQERKGVELKISNKDLLPPLELCGFRVCSDLSDNHRLAQHGRQPVRRSASMDVNAASIFCFSVGNSPPLEEEEDEGSSVVQIEKGKKAHLSPELHRLTGSSSNEKLLAKSPALMKRSFSSGGKLVSSKSSRNRSSILPLVAEEKQGHFARQIRSGTA